MRLTLTSDERGLLSQQMGFLYLRSEGTVLPMEELRSFIRNGGNREKVASNAGNMMAFLRPQ